MPGSQGGCVKLTIARYLLCFLSSLVKAFLLYQEFNFIKSVARFLCWQHSYIFNKVPVCSWWKMNIVFLTSRIWTWVLDAGCHHYNNWGKRNPKDELALYTAPAKCLGWDFWEGSKGRRLRNKVYEVEKKTLSAFQTKEETLRLLESQGTQLETIKPSHVWMHGLLAEEESHERQRG